MSVPEKLKCSIYICCLERSKKTKIELSFSKDYFSIYFIEPLKEENIKEIKEIFSSFFSEKSRLIKINYIYIKAIYANNSHLLKFTLHNPASVSVFTLIFNHFKYKKSILFPELNIPSSMLTSITLDINKKIINLTEKKINDFIDVIHLLYQFISSERKYNEIIENLFSKAFIFGKSYYDKCCKEFSINNKKNIESMNEETANKINKYLSEMKIEKESNNKTNLIEQIKKAHKSSSSIEEEDEEKSKTKNMEIIDKILVNNGIENIEYNPHIYLALEIDTNNQRDLFQNYEKFIKYLPEIKTKTSYFSEISINLVFKVLNINKVDLNNKYNMMNKSAIGLRINNKLNAMPYEPSQTNYNLKNSLNDINNINNETLKDNNNYENINNLIKKYYSDESNINQNYEKYINELFEFSKKFNSFVPNNSIENIVSNTSQIIHRKFFELFLKYYFSDIIGIEIEKNKTMSSDVFHQILLILRRLKKILFTFKNINYYEEFLFLQEQ